MKQRRLNLGCGTVSFPSCEEIEWINVDIVNSKNVDLVWDLNNYPYPFEDESFNIINMDDVLEHLDNPLEALKECHRLLKKEGVLKIKVVYWNHKYSFSDLTHLHAFSEISFNCLVGKGRPLNLDFRFSDLRVEYGFSSEAQKKYGTDNQVLLEKAFFRCNVIQFMIVTLIK